MTGWKNKADGVDKHPESATDARNARYGLRLFVIYTLIYAGFVLLNTFAPQAMEWVPAAGLNVAIWYGFGLILVALLLSLVYGWLCRASSAPDRNLGDRS